MSKPALRLGPRLLPVHRGCPCSALVVGTRWVGGGQSRGGEGPEAHVCRLPGSLLSPQQRARVSQQELRYLWVWVSLSATESVQEVLLEGHPSWKYLKEVHTLLLDVQQSLRDVEVSPKVDATVSLLSAPRLSLKLVRPKALLDNCFRVMELLYCSCCKQSSVLNWQDCELPSPQPHSAEPSSQCLAAQLYPRSQKPPISLPRSPGFKTGPPAP
uniref:Interleukin 34 n=1 Tax=Ailuropoda melanoleuca TaxID=9646 RepID=A0A7N5KGA8_AILME